MLSVSFFIFMILVLKVLLIPFAAIMVFVNVIDIINWGFDNFLSNFRIFGIVFLVLIAVVLLSYLIYAAIMGEKYCVIFEMDEKGIVHEQQPQQFRKAQKLGAVTAAAGGVTGGFTTAGAGLLAASHNATVSDFDRVRRVKPRRWFHVIKVNQLLTHNQIYVRNEDFDFVYDFIKSHCPNAK